MLLFLAALILYLPGLWWGATHATAANRSVPWGSDELAPLQAVTEVYGVFFAHQPHFNPQYPLFQNLMQSLLVLPYLVLLWLTGGLGHPQSLYPFGFTNPVRALYVTTMLARTMSLLMAAGVVTTAYQTGKVLWNQKAGVITGLLVLSIYPMFYYSRTSNVDMGALFWTALGLLVFAYCLRDGLTVRRAIWLGVFAGLATGTKDASWPAFFLMGGVVAYDQFRRSDSLPIRANLRPLAAGAATAIGSYAVASGLIFRPSRYLLHLRWITRDGLQGYYRLPPTPGGYLQLMIDLLQNLRDALGTPMAICAGAGILFCILRDRRMLKWLLPAIGVVLLVLVPARYVLIRFVLVIAYVLTFFAALLFQRLLEWPVSRKPAAALLGVVLAWSLVRGGDLTYQMLFDSRYEVAAWLHRNAHPGDRILYYTNACNLPQLDAGILSIPANERRPYTYVGNRQDPEFVVLIPITQYASEPVHERVLPEDVYQSLGNGSSGYRRVLSLQTARLFSRRPVPFVNPRVTLFVRKDLNVSGFAAGR
jgi:hypothetical protein